MLRRLAAHLNMLSAGELSNSTSTQPRTMPTFDIPKTCKGAVVVNEGPDFHVEVQNVPVPDIGM